VSTAEDRPVDPTPVNTPDLPATPTRDRNIPASAWVEAPDELRRLEPEALYKRRIGRWLLWRSGPARGAHATYVALDADDLARVHTFALTPEGTGSGKGPSGTTHGRFRTWKEDLRDHG